MKTNRGVSYSHACLTTPRSDDVVVLELVPARRQEPPRYWSWTVAGILAHNLVFGFVARGLSAEKTPIFVALFGMSVRQANLIDVSRNAVYVCKAVFGLLSDCFPIYGYRRKAYMLLGWTLALVCLIYFSFQDYKDVTNTSGAHVTSLAIVCVLAVLGLVLASVACDAYMVEFSRHEEDCRRGRLLSLTWGARSIGRSIANIAIAVIPRTKRTTGFTWSIDFSAYFGGLVGTVLLLLLVIASMQEALFPVVNCPQFIDQFWTAMQQRPMWKTLLFTFLVSFFAAAPDIIETSPFTFGWAQRSDTVLPFSLALNAAGYALFALVVQMSAKYWDWRWSMAVGNLVQALGDGCVALFAVYDGCRSQWMVFIVTFALQLPLALTNFVLSVILIEVAEPGQEGITYGMLTTMQHAVYVFVPYFSSGLVAPFKIDKSVAFDSPHMRYLMAMPLFIGYALFALPSAFVWLLPRQRDHVRFLKEYVGRQPFMAGVALVLCYGSVIVAIVMGSLNLAKF